MQERIVERSANMDDLQRAVNLLALGDTSDLKPVELAVQAMENGLDSPSLGRLASWLPSDEESPWALFERVVQELGIKAAPREAIATDLVFETARQIASGAVPPYDGAKRIWSYASHELGMAADLHIFGYFEDEWEDDPEHRDAYEHHIIRAARRLSKRGLLRTWLGLESVRGESPLKRYSDGWVRADADDLHVSDELRRDIHEWAADFDRETNADNAASSVFNDVAAATRFADRGSVLAQRLQIELGPAWAVGYTPVALSSPPEHGDSRPFAEAIRAQRQGWYDWYASQRDVAAPRGSSLYTCPCCGHPTLSERGGFEVCDECGWQDDGQDDHDSATVRGDANGGLSLDLARSTYIERGGVRGDHRPPGPPVRRDRFLR